METVRELSEKIQTEFGVTADCIVVANKQGEQYAPEDAVGDLIANGFKLTVGNVETAVPASEPHRE